MSNYRIKFEYPFYSVQERISVGWWIFKKDIWTQLEFFYDLHDAESLYKTLIKNERKYK